MKNLNKKWFTIVELVIVVTILVILSSVWFINYVWNLSDSRNATRISEISNLKVSLSSTKLKRWVYPSPWNYFEISNYWSWIVKQWYMNSQVYSTDIVNKPTDPLLKNRYYTYSITSKWNFFQLSTIIEKTDGLISYVDWDFQTVSLSNLPSIIFATWSSFDISTNKSKFIVDKWTKNLPYDEDWNIVSKAKNISEIINEPWINIPKFFWYYSCEEIYDSWRNFWSWTYQILDNSWNLKCVSCPSNGSAYTSSSSCTF